MKENEYLLYKQNIKGNKKIGSDEIKELFREQPNRNILGYFPYLYAYYVGRNHLDTAKIQKKIITTTEYYQQKINKIDTTIDNKKKAGRVRKIELIREKRDKKLDKQNLKLKDGNWLMRVVGEPPSIYDSSNTNYNKRQIRFYLNSRGYFLNNLTVKVDTNSKKITENYSIVEGQPYVVKQLEYIVPDTAIDGILKLHLKDAQQIQGKKYEESKLTEERERINVLLKDNGYYDFNTQYILVEIDSTLGQNQMAIRIIVRNPPKLDMHPRYKIAKIFFNTDISRAARQSNVSRDTVYYNGIHYIYAKDDFSKKILTKKVRIHPGDYYTQSRVQLTQRQLANLDMYRFININFDKIMADTTRSDTIFNDSLVNGLIVNIRTSPQKKYQTTEEAGLNISSAGFVPGPFGSLNFKIRNTFKGFELFEASLRASVLGQTSVTDPTKINSSEEYNADVSLTFPQFFFPGALRFKLEDYAPRTRLNAGYTLIRRPEYTRGNIRSTINYIFTKGLYSQYNLSLFDLNAITTYDTSRDFSIYLNELKNRGNPLINSFSNSIVSDINGSYTYNNNQLGNNNKSQYYKLYLESGGTTLNFIKDVPFLRDAFSNEGNTLNVGKGLKTFRYYKINTDLRYYFPDGKNTFVIRLNVGYANPYDEGGVLPYEKYFFMGGSNSMRAWQPRRLGPGTFFTTDPGETEPNYRIEQPGDIAIENNYEYRFKIFGFFEGATFIDVGNIWSLRESKGRPGSEFKFNSFLTQFGVGPGVGLRLNFSFLILRLDVATKAVDPAQRNNKFVLLDRRGWRDPRLNIGIGYPF